MRTTKKQDAIQIFTYYWATAFTHYRQIAYGLGISAILLSCISFISQMYLFTTGVESNILHIFNIDGENTIPSYFSTILLLATSVLLVLIFLIKNKQSEPYRKHWLGLAVIFLYLSLDECIGLHERLIGITQKLSGINTGIFFLAWVIPFGIFVILFGLVYLRFLWHLPLRFRWLFIAAGTIYVFGAIGMEIIGGHYMEKNGWNLTLHFLFTIEETLEMLGVIMFIAVLLNYLSQEFSDINTDFHQYQVVDTQGISENANG